MIRRLLSLALLFACALGAAPAWSQAAAAPRFEFLVRDKVFLTVTGKPRLARIYQPRGDGGFPTLVLLHGGGWNDRDRTDSADTALALADAGILVISIE